MPDSLLAWGLVTSHGEGAKSLMQGLHGGVCAPVEVSQAQWPVPANGRSLAFYVPGERKGSVRSALASRLQRAWNEAESKLSATELASVRGDCALIFSSTKGCVEDYIWAGSNGDPFGGIVEDFLSSSGIRPKRWLTVSNACASSHSSLHLAREWLARGETEHVIVLAADAVGPFVLQGFHALHALSPSLIRPYDRNRDGLLLGEAAAVAVLSRREGELRISGSALDCEGHAVTRPESSAASLQRAIVGALGAHSVDGVISHATATVANDRAEDRAFTAQLPDRPWVTGTKWSVGHTLGASGLVDLVAAAEWLRSGQPFALETCLDPDPDFRSRLLTKEALADLAPRAWRSLLVTALGFGGVHAAYRLERT
jgi:3-oxoacyl-(acyl-carrier-protein) synthase